MQPAQEGVPGGQKNVGQSSEGPGGEQLKAGFERVGSQGGEEQQQQSSRVEPPSLKTRPSDFGAAWTQEELDSSSPFHRAAAAHEDLQKEH